ncbi:hypothetical protein ACFQ0Q_14005 [Streptomyces aureus]
MANFCFSAEVVAVGSATAAATVLPDFLALVSLPPHAVPPTRSAELTMSATTARRMGRVEPVTTNLQGTVPLLPGSVPRPLRLRDPGEPVRVSPAVER